MRILIVEDDIELSASISEYLELQGVECDFSYNGTSALNLISRINFDVILLDLMLPKLNGYDVCSKLRSSGCSKPIIMLTAMGATEEQLGGFQAGVDDYVVKPCAMPLLWARIQALYKRSQNQQAIQVLGPLTIDIESRQLQREGQPITLTATEWKILEVLLFNSPKIVSRDDIERFVWPDQEPDKGRLNVHLFALRKAVDKPFPYPLIKTIVGLGLCIKCDDNDTKKS